MWQIFPYYSVFRAFMFSFKKRKFKREKLNTEEKWAKTMNKSSPELETNIKKCFFKKIMLPAPQQFGNI